MYASIGLLEKSYIGSRFRTVGWCDTTASTCSHMPMSSLQSAPALPIPRPNTFQVAPSQQEMEREMYIRSPFLLAWRGMIFFGRTFPIGLFVS